MSHFVMFESYKVVTMENQLLLENQVYDLTCNLLRKSQKLTTSPEKRRMKLLNQMIQDSNAKTLITNITDQLYRSSSDAKIADQMVFLMKHYGTPSFLPISDLIGFKLFEHLGKTYPSFFVKQLKKEIRKQIDPVLFKMKKGVALNLNHLGEAVLGETEAKRRLEQYLLDLENPALTCISVKVSTLYSQINLVAFEETLHVLKERLRILYRKAGTKFVYLDMEEYKDLDLTVALFKEVLSENEFINSSHGIALQSYLPESFDILKSLTSWALERSQTPIHVRIVKGANLAMEKVESSLRGWPQAPFEHKWQTDANFKKMITFALTPEHMKAVRIGIGSHNLFDIAYSMLIAKRRNVRPRFEMLEGMAEPMQRALKSRGEEILVYSPEVSEKDFQFAVGYLLRRLDENTGPENFLRHIFNLKIQSEAFEKQASHFRKSFRQINHISSEKRRSQNRLQESYEKKEPFTNEPDTDFSLAENRTWIKRIYEEWKNKDINFYQKVSLDDLKNVLGMAKTWKFKTQVLKKAAALFRENRAQLIGAMIAESKKVAEEADIEVSEAIDFIEYYRQNPFEIEPKGTILVAPPWNFPCSIPTGSITAALVAGNAVLFKPAPETVFIGSLIANLFWQAGIPKETLQFIPCNDDPEGSFLVQNVAAVVLTGATETARKMMQMRPSLDLIAETGGKNTMIITALSDRDLAISDLLKSAFGHAGQKCSACSLAILEKEVYDDPLFLRQLQEATLSLKTGSQWEKDVKIPPLIRPFKIPPLEEGESWLVEPKIRAPDLITAGIKMGVKKASFTHQTELFGPILGLMRANDLPHAIELANSTPYGLTAGLHSLDTREHHYWKNRIIAGNLYINRTITGAIVGRQPFGGTKASSFGPGAKAGGPNYVLQMGKVKEPLCHKQGPLSPSLIPLISSSDLSEEEMKIWKKAAGSYAYYANELKKPYDPSQLLGQDNFFYHVPYEHMIFRIEEGDSPLHIFQVIAAAVAAKTPLFISSYAPFPFHKIQVEAEKEFFERVANNNFTRLRLLHKPSEKLMEVAAAKGIYIIYSKPFLNGRFELLHYLREVSLSINTHRYGYLAN